MIVCMLFSQHRQKVDVVAIIYRIYDQDISTYTQPSLRGMTKKQQFWGFAEPAIVERLKQQHQVSCPPPNSCVNVWMRTRTIHLFPMLVNRVIIIFRSKTRELGKSTLPVLTLGQQCFRLSLVIYIPSSNTFQLRPHHAQWQSYRMIFSRQWSYSVSDCCLYVEVRHVRYL